MAFNDREISTQDGRPVTLYAFRWDKTWWRYTSADRPIEREELVGNVMQTVTYEPKPIKDNGMVQGGSAQNDFAVDGPFDLPIAELFRGTPPSESIWLTVRRLHYGDDGIEAPIYWKGQVLNVRRPTPGTCQILGKPLIATLKRTGLRLCWSRECPHYLYDTGCKVDPADYAVAAEVTSLDGTTIVATPAEAKSEGWWRGGYLEWEANEDGTVERRMIEADAVAGANVVLSIFGLTDRLEVGMEITLYPGCNRTPEICENKFDNLPNHGGFGFMPGKTPFGTAIW